MADLEEQTSLISQFCAVAGVDQNRARFYLELENWILDLALANFFDNSEADSEQVEMSDTSPQAAVGATTSQPTAQTRPTAAGHVNQPSRIATIGSLKGDSESSDEEGQAYYAGGSERGGGQQIIGPSKKKNSDTHSLVSNIFQAAKERGAEVVDDESGAQQHSAFVGRAYKLGDNVMQSEIIEGRNMDLDNPHVKVVLKLWKNGFSINNGPLRDFEDPASQKFMQEIRQGQVPRELINEARGGEVHLNMEDHRHEDYIKPPTVIQPFAGQGHRLGCPLDPVSEANSSARVMAGTTSTPLSGASGSLRDTEAAATLNVDQTQPTTSLQIRLADGARLTTTFNHSHRIADIRQYIITARPDYASTRFVLMTTFPNAELNDELLTLSEAKLLNSVIFQRDSLKFETLKR